jgi:hypothetical protein
MHVTGKVISVLHCAIKHLARNTYGESRPLCPTLQNNLDHELYETNIFVFHAVEITYVKRVKSSLYFIMQLSNVPCRECIWGPPPALPYVAKLLGL